MRALQLSQSATGSGSFSGAQGRAYVDLGKALLARGKTQEAREAFQYGAEHLDKSLGQDHQESRNAHQLADTSFR